MSATPEQAAAEYGRKVGNPAVVNRVDFSAGWRAREPEVAALRKVVEAARDIHELGMLKEAMAHPRSHDALGSILAALDKEQGRG